MSDAKRRRRGAAPAPTVRVALACNGDQGIFAGTAEAINLTAGAQHVELEPSRCRPPRLTMLDGDRFQIFRRVFAYSADREWVGNWCWNEYVVMIDDAARLLHAALTAGFTCTGATGDEACELSDLCDEFPEWNEHALRDQMLKMTVTK